MSDFTNTIAEVQAEIKAPKNQYNEFAGFCYRSAEDILEVAKPILFKHGLIMTLTDDIVNMGDKNYVKATVTITDGENSISTSAYAREAEERKGMDDSQITGTASSYARKYALNGIFCLDDNKDVDSMDNSNSRQAPKKTTKPEETEDKEDRVKIFKAFCNRLYREDPVHIDIVRKFHDFYMQPDTNDRSRTILEGRKFFNPEKMWEKWSASERY